MTERHLQVVFCHRTPPEGGTLLDKGPILADLTTACVDCVPSSPLPVVNLFKVALYTLVL